MSRRHSGDQFADAESSSGIGCPPTLAFDQVITAISKDAKKENCATSPWSTALSLSTPVGRGQMLDVMRVKCPQVNDKDIKRKLETVEGLKYDDSWLIPREEINQKKLVPHVENSPTAGTSSQRDRFYRLNTEDTDFYSPLDSSELNKAPGFVMNDDDFPPL